VAADPEMTITPVSVPEAEYRQGDLFDGRRFGKRRGQTHILTNDPPDAPGQNLDAGVSRIDENGVAGVSIYTPRGARPHG
jgi:hypothetical protein